MLLINLKNNIKFKIPLNLITAFKGLIYFHTYFNSNRVLIIIPQKIDVNKKIRAYETFTIVED